MLDDDDAAVENPSRIGAPRTSSHAADRAQNAVGCRETEQMPPVKSASTVTPPAPTGAGGGRQRRKRRHWLDALEDEVIRPC